MHMAEENITPDTDAPETPDVPATEEAPAVEPTTEEAPAAEPETTEEAPAKAAPAKEAAPAPAKSNVVEDLIASASEAADEANVQEAALQAVPEHIRTGPAFRLFTKYDLSEITVRDPGLVRYINLYPVAIPHTGARHGNKRFAKHGMNIVERVINEMMKTETWTGKKASAFRAVRDAFAIIEERAKENPVQVLVKALQNAAPREEITRLRYGGISVPKAVDVAPARRLDIAIRHITRGAVNTSHKSKNTIADCLAGEILKASKADMNSFAVAKKEEVERVAKSAR